MKLTTISNLGEKIENSSFQGRLGKNNLVLKNSVGQSSGCLFYAV